MAKHESPPSISITIRISIDDPEGGADIYLGQATFTDCPSMNFERDRAMRFLKQRVVSRGWAETIPSNIIIPWAEVEACV